MSNFEQKCAAADMCPKCGGELDTGWECNKCAFDAMPLIQETKNGEIFAGVTVQCCHPEADCVCGGSERVLRGYIRGNSLPPMTKTQREWCLDEIGSVEGYDRKDYEQYSDADLASSVLHAWTDFCRDKGLI